MCMQCTVYIMFFWHLSYITHPVGTFAYSPKKTHLDRLAMTKHVQPSKLPRWPLLRPAQRGWPDHQRRCLRQTGIRPSARETRSMACHGSQSDWRAWQPYRMATMRDGAMSGHPADIECASPIRKHILGESRVPSNRCWPNRPRMAI